MANRIENLIYEIADTMSVEYHDAATLYRRFLTIAARRKGTSTLILEIKISQMNASKFDRFRTGLIDAFRKYQNWGK